jgi:predicted cupin superfamily sugar epimerase
LIIKSAEYWIENLQLQAHPEGGFYREKYRSNEVINKAALPDRYSGDRNFSTSIYFSLRSQDISAFHRITSDELWFFHAGSPVEIFILDKNLNTIQLGPNPDKGEVLQCTIPKSCWFGAKVSDVDSYVLVSCTVAPGFDFDNFELAKREALSSQFPVH